jgi:hypothetical protein
VSFIFIAVDVMSLFQAVSRLNEKRTYFGREALQIVQKHFAAKEYKGRPKEIKKYALWAMRENGPGLWEVPTPIDSTVASDANYTVSLLHTFFL